MAKILWDQAGEHLYETGVKQGVLYVESTGTYPAGVAWNGLTAVTETPSGAEETALYADDDKYLSLRSKEQFGGTIEAYTYPDEFMQCDGSANLGDIAGVVIGQQTRKTFGFCYRTSVGNDSSGNDYGYKLHMVYGATASPSERAYSTINDSPEAITFSWEFSTIPVDVPSSIGDYKKTSIVTIDTTQLTQVTRAKVADLEAILYGVDAPTFSAESTYAVGDYVTYSSGSPEVAKVYKCKTAITTPGAWDASKWDEVTNPGPRLPLPAEIHEIFTVAQG